MHTRHAPRRGYAQRRWRWVPDGRRLWSPRGTWPAAAPRGALTPPAVGGARPERRPARSRGNRFREVTTCPGPTGSAGSCRQPLQTSWSTAAAPRPGLAGAITPFLVMISGAQPGGGEREGALGRGSWARHRWKTIIKLFGNSLSPGSVAETWTQWPETRSRSTVRRCGLVARG